jgi:hypothetical protein
LLLILKNPIKKNTALKQKASVLKTPYCSLQAKGSVGQWRKALSGVKKQFKIVIGLIMGHNVAQKV